MGRPSKKIETADNGEMAEVNVQDTLETQTVNETENSEAFNENEEQPDNKAGQTTETFNDNETEKTELSPRVLELMRLYPQYEKLWITSRGFVHPEGTPKYLLKDAKLYENKFYNK